MQKLPKGTHTKEFREQAVKLVLEEGLSLRQAELRLSPKTVQNWVLAARKGTRSWKPGDPSVRCG